MSTSCSTRPARAETKDWWSRRRISLYARPAGKVVAEIQEGAGNARLRRHRRRTGHGKRRNVLSDYTFAIRAGDELLNIGKAYSGLTDAEIERVHEAFPEHHHLPGTGRCMSSSRKSYWRSRSIESRSRSVTSRGSRMRFPRIARIRDDKTVDEISTIDEVRRIYEGQLKREQDALDGSPPTSRVGCSVV